ncbi:MAG: thiamine phosphate synthase [Elusimicrobiota bacterium]
MQFPKEGIYFLFNPRRWTNSPWETNLKNLFSHIDVLQLRAPELNDREFHAVALKIKDILKDTNIPFIVNNRVDIAILAGSDGIHLGSEDMPVQEAKKIFTGFIGASRHTQQGARQAETAGATYIGCGPVFKTDTKSLNRKTIGPEGYLKVKKSVDIPVIPIGGINQENIKKIQKYSSVFAVSSAVNKAGNPEKICRKLKSHIL